MGSIGGQGSLVDIALPEHLMLIPSPFAYVQDHSVCMNVLVDRPRRTPNSDDSA